MTDDPLRFVHASDLHLELPLHGVAEIPDSLRDNFVDAPYDAARSVFDAVLDQQADFLILSGDVLDFSLCGAREILFLREQFERLAAQDVPVFWAGSHADPPEQWPGQFPLPDNVYRFGRQAEEHYFEPNSGPQVRLIGISDYNDSAGPEDLHVSGRSSLTIFVVHGSLSHVDVTDQGVNYWALGSKHCRDTQTAGKAVIHDAGTPQGRSPKEHGSRGCSLVTIAGDERPEVTTLATDVLRWQTESLSIEPEMHEGLLRQQMLDRLAELDQQSDGRPLLVSWLVRGQGPMLASLRHGRIAEELLSAARASFLAETSSVWSVALDTSPPDELPTRWQDEESLLGEFLRNLRDLQDDASQAIEVETFLNEQQRDAEIGALVAIADGHERQHVLRRASTLGVELLRGGEPHVEYESDT